MHEVMLDYDMDIMNLLSQIYRPDISRLQGGSDHFPCACTTRATSPYARTFVVALFSTCVHYTS